MGRGFIGFWLGRATQNDRGGTEDGDGLASGLTLTGGNAIAVSDQPPGNAVTIQMVVLATSSWVVIHEDAEGKPGRILGARRFDGTGGKQQSGGVDLLRGTEEGRVYYAMLHLDDGDRQFDHTKDLPIADQQGNVILMRFVASANPEE